MAIQYHVYANDGANGPVDYSTILATVSALTWPTTAMAFSSDWTWAIRTYDTVTGLEDQNTDARVRIIVGPAGQDLSRIPNAPTGLQVFPTAGGTAKLSFAYNPGGQAAPPTGFHVYVGTPTPNYSVIAATVPYASSLTFSTTLSGFSNLTNYQAAVRAYNASGEEANTKVCPFTALATGPLPVSGLTAAIIS